MWLKTAYKSTGKIIVFKEFFQILFIKLIYIPFLKIFINIYILKALIYTFLIEYMNPIEI